MAPLYFQLLKAFQPIMVEILGKVGIYRLFREKHGWQYLRSTIPFYHRVARVGKHSPSYRSIASCNLF